MPNFSEGRRKAVIAAVVRPLKKIEAVKLLGVESDPDHNRTVVTLVGTPAGCLRAAFLMTKEAVRLINIEKHQGEHPRIGAMDVIPFIPMAGVTMGECVSLANKLGRLIAQKLKVPVYLYEEAARRSERRNLAVVRQGEYEGLKKEILVNPARRPDYGPARLHATAGAVAVGARKPLIAFNVYLETRNVAVAKDIAKTIRERDGGFPAVKALGLEMRKKGCTQVSMNLCDFEKTNLDGVFWRIKELAAAHHVKVLKSEIYGLLPLASLVKLARDVLQAEDLTVSQVLERRLT